MKESTRLNRRQVLGLFGAGLGTAIVAGGSQVDEQGGNLYGGTDAMAQAYKVGPRMWKGPLSVRSEVPAESGNDFIRTDAGSNNDQYEFYHHDGSSWSLQGWNVSSLGADHATTKEGPVFDVTAWGAVGDGSTDDRQAIQAAIDAASDAKGRVYFPDPDAYYQVGVGGSDPDGVDYCLAAKSDVECFGDGWGASEVRSAVNDASLFWFDSVERFYVRDMTVDSNYHNVDQPSGDNLDAMVMKVGRRHSSSEQCFDIGFERLLVTGAMRHGIESAAGSERGYIRDCVFDDASGDDDVSLSWNSKYWLVEGCWSINKVREKAGDWSAACFEAEDGATHVTFRDCHAINPASGISGFTAGKSHPSDPVANHNHVVGCTAVKCRHAFGHSSGGDGQTTTGLKFLECVADQPTSTGATITVSSSGHTLRDVEVDIEVRNSDGHGVNFINHGRMERVHVTPGTKIRDAGDRGIQFVDQDSTNARFADFTIEPSYVHARIEPIQFRGTNTNYEGDTVVTGVEAESDQGRSLIDFIDNTNVREHVRVIDTKTGLDFSSHVPAAPFENMKYYDNGTNTGSGTKGERRYINSAWQDIWTV